MTDTIIFTEEIATLKICSTCGESKPLTEFSPNGNGLIRSQCKQCRSVKAKAERTTECLDCGADI